MAEITAADVKRLRDATGAGMMACKKALEETGGDQDAAVEVLRKKGETKVRERGAERTTSAGLVQAAEGVMVELRCETDFVAKGENFQQLAADIVAHAAGAKVGDREALLAETLADGRTVQENIDSVAAVIGEKLELGEVVRFDGTVASYMHRRSADLPPAVGVLVAFTGDDLAAARGAAMHIAAMKPQFLTRDQVPAETVENERRVAEEIARKEGKPEGALAKIVEGRVNGFYKDVVLLEQPSVQDAKKTVKQLLDEAKVTVTDFARFEVGSK